MRKREGIDGRSKWEIDSVDQIIEVFGHSPSKGVHHKVHPFLYHLHLCNHVRWSRICDGWSTHTLSFWSTGALLPSGPSWSLLLALVPSWSSFWVPFATFLCRSYSSRSWFCLVRCSTAAVRVWTYLSRAMGRGSSPWTLLVAAIERVSTMQLFVQEAIVWLTSH